LTQVPSSEKIYAPSQGINSPKIYFKVPHSKAVYYHVRISWLASNENPTKENNSHLYEPKLQSFFNDDFVKTVHSNYQKVMEEVETNMGRKPITYYEVFDILPKCLKE
jgi:hypothetical protein